MGIRRCFYRYNTYRGVPGGIWRHISQWCSLVYRKQGNIGIMHHIVSVSKSKVSVWGRITRHSVNKDYLQKGYQW